MRIQKKLGGTSKTVFISYSREEANNQWVQKLARDLNQFNIQVILDVNDSLGGDDINSKIFKGIQKSDYFITVLTPSYNKKITDQERWLYKEYHQFNGLKMIGKAPSLIPILKSGSVQSSIPKDLQGLTYIDMSVPDSYPAGLKALIRKIQPELSTNPGTQSNAISAGDHKTYGLTDYKLSGIPTNAPIVAFWGDSGSGKSSALIRLCRLLEQHNYQIIPEASFGSSIEYKNHVRSFIESIRFHKATVLAPTGEFPMFLELSKSNKTICYLLDIPGTHIHYAITQATESYLYDLLISSNKRVNLLFTEWSRFRQNSDYLYEFIKLVRSSFTAKQDTIIPVLSKADQSPHLSTNEKETPYSRRIIKEVASSNYLNPLVESLGQKGMVHAGIIPMASIKGSDGPVKNKESSDYLPKRFWKAIQTSVSGKRNLFFR